MEIALIIVALIAAGLGLAAWRLNGRVAGQDPDLRRIEEERDEALGALGEVQRELAARDAQMAERSERLAAAERERDEAREARETAERERGETQRELAARDAQMAERGERLAAAERERGEARKARETAERERDEARDARETAEQQLAARDAQMAERDERLAAAERERGEAREARETAEREQDKAQRELAARDAQMAERGERLAAAERERGEARKARETAERERDEAREAREAAEQQLAAQRARVEEIEKARAELDARFKEIAAEVAKSSNAEFREQAAEQFKRQTELAEAEHETRRQAVDNLVKPVGETLEQLQKRVGEIEKARETAYVRVEELVGATGRQLGELREATSGLRSALSSPQQRGRWGELTLERVLETAGMREHVDYNRQPRTATEDGAVRPDAVIRLPRGLTVPVDAKTPLEAYLRAHEANNETEQRIAREQHARSLMGHARSLGSKNYAEAIGGQSPEFVVLFVPTETILDAAMHAQPSIWEDAWSQHRVLIASPGLLIALLRTIGVAWQQESIQRNAQAIAAEAGELYNRLAIYTDHITRMGKSLESTVKTYNDSIGSFQSRVLPQARRMEELGAVEESRRIEEPDQIDSEVRVLQAPEVGEGES